jgi:RHS repeat-associated protein
MRIRIRISLLVVAAFLFGALPPALADDPFAIGAPFTSRAVFSCGDLTHSDGIIDSGGISSPGPTGQGHVASNGNIKMSGGANVHGNATAGPGKTVSNSGSSYVTGTKSSATALIDCKPIDLTALATSLQASNDNAKLPRTGQGKDPLTGTAHTDFNLSGGDTITLPGGTYYFTKFTMSGGSVVNITGPVRILSTGDVNISGGSVNNAPTGSAYTPYRLRFYCSSGKFTLSSATMAGFVYAPSGTYTNSAAHLIGGAFANLVTVSGSSHVTRAIDDIQPKVTITSPADGAIVADAAHVAVRGTVVENETAVTLQVNGHDVPIAADGTFQTTLDLTGVSPATITATATDAAGNIGTAKVTVVTVPPPTLSLTSPAPGALVNKRVVDLVGGAGTATTVTVNGQPATVANGVWTVTGFDLGNDGAHTLTIVGTNVGGSNTISPVITSDTVNPSITATTSPQPNAAGWNKSDVTVHFTCSDSGTGIATCPADVVVGSEGMNQPVTRTATDRAGNSASVTVTVNIDKTAPSITVEAPQNNALLGDPHLVVTGTADDAIAVTINGAAATVDTTARTFSGNVSLLEGTNALHLVGTDLADNSGSADVSVNLDTRPPAIVIAVPATACVDTAALDVRGTVADPHVSTITVTVGAASANATVDANGNWSASVPVDEGKKLITVEAKDALAHSTSVSRSVSIDRTAPAVDIIDSGAPITKTAFNRAVSLFVRVADADPNVVVVSKLDGAAYASGTPIAAEGSHTLAVTATDCAGHSSSKSATFVVDLTAPSIRNLTPANGGRVGTMPNAISGTTDVDAVSVQLSGTALAATPGADGSFTIAGVPFVEGSNAFALVAIDRAGNSSTLDYAVTVKTAAPSVEIRESGLPIAEGALFNRTVTPVIRSAELNATVTATLDGAAFTSGTTISADGAHKLVGTATDSFGHSGSAEVNFTIDRTPPVVKITAPAAGTIQSDHVQVRGTAGDAVAATVNGQPVVLGSDGSFVVDALPLDAGDNQIVATGTDRAGNAGRDTVLVTRDDLGAGVLITYPPDHSLTNRPTTDVVGRLLTLGRGTVVTLGTTTLTVDPTGEFRVSGYALKEGENTITVTSTAANGVQSSATTHVTADFTPPSLTILESGQPLADGARFATQAVISLQSADAGGGAVTTTLTIDGTKTTTTPFTLSTAGGHSIIAVARDLAGNETRAERTLFIGASSGGTTDCKLDSFDPANGAVILSNSTTLVGRSGGAIGVKVNGVAATVADGAFTATVELPNEGANAVTIACTDASGTPTGTPVTITLQRVTGNPSISITAPDENFATAQESIPVSGTVGAGVISADVNGVAATITGSTFTVPNVRLAPGLNIVVAHGRNAAGRVATASRRGVYLKDAPSISISAPSNNASTGTAAITVSGTYTNLDPATIVIGTTAAQAVRTSDTTGSFTVPNVPLTSGANTLTVTGRDRLNRTATASVVVTLLTGAPSIAITSPADHAYFGAGAANVTVSGTFQAAAGSTVDVNGVAATLTGNNFTATAPFSTLAGGITPIVARVTEPGGASASAAISVTQLTAAPTVVESFPAPNAAEVDNGALMLVLFSQPMDVATISGAFRLEDAAGTPVSGTVYLDKDVLTFAPATLLASGGRYTLRVTTAAKNLAGTPLAADYTAAFTVGASAPSTAPTLTPITAAVCGRSLTVSGTATPGARVRLDSGTLTLNASADTTGKFSFTYPISGQSGFALVRVSTVGSDGSLSPAAELNIRIDCSGPQVLSASLERTTNKVTIQFSEPIDATTATVGTGNAILLALDDGRAIAGTASVNESLVTITPAEDLAAKNVSLTVTTAIKDRIGNALTSPYSQTFAVGTTEQPASGDGSGFISGEVYDATTGRPLAAASITIDSNPPVTTSADARGRYVARLPEGAHTIKASLTGYTSVWREIIVPAGAGVVPIDIRLTKRGVPATSNGSAIALTHGGDTTVTKKIDLAVPAAALTSGSTIALTSMGAQALTGLLPLGWSPLASGEVNVNGADTAVALSGAQLTFNVNAADVTAAAQNLTAVAYDAVRDEWRVLVAAANVGADGKVVVPISGSGAYALVYPDKAAGLTTPPLPVAGDVLRGVPAAPDNAPALVKRDFTLNPSVILPTGRAVATLRIEGGTATFPSGTAVQAYVDEELRLADGSRLLDPPFATDLLLYRTLTGDLGVADFHLGPSAKAAEVVLETGVDHVHIQPYPGRLDRGTLIGSEGGRVPADDKVAIDIPSGAVPEPLRATATSMSSTDLAGIGAVAGFRVVGGFTLTLQRVTEPAPVDLDGDGKPDPVAPVELFVPARAAFTVDASKLPSPTVQVILAEVLDTTPYGQLIRLADPMAPVDPTQTSTPAIRFLTKPIDRSVLPVDGITHEGRFLVLAAEAPIAYATGTVHSLSATGRLLSDARVTAPPLGVAELSRSTGIYNVPVPAVPAAPFTLIPRHTTTGDGAPYINASAPAADAVVHVDLALVPQPPTLTSVVVLKGNPPSQGTLVAGVVATDVALTTNVRASFSPGIDPATIADDSIVVTNAFTGSKVSGKAAADGTTAVVWTLTAGTRLEPNTRYNVSLSASIRGTNGAAFGQSLTFPIATITQLVNSEIHREKIRITIPVDGVSKIIGDPGALPAGWQAVVVRRNKDFIVRYQGTAATDGSFTFFVGNGGDPHDHVTMADLLDLQVVNTNGTLSGIYALTPFVTEDGHGFVAPPSIEVRFTSPEGIAVDVPAGAFDVPTVVTVNSAKKQDFLDIPRIEDENEYATSVDIEFAGYAKKRLDVEVPVPAGFDTTGKDFLLTWKGSSVRGPRLAVADLMHVSNGKFTTIPDTVSASRKMTLLGLKPGTNRTLTGRNFRNYLIGLILAGRYMVLDIKQPVGGAVGWAAMEGAQTNYDLIWDTFWSYYDPYIHVFERPTRVIPVIQGLPFTVFGIDRTTGLQAFQRAYDPLPVGQPGDITVIGSPQQNDGGPYPVFGSPFRVEVADLDVEDIDITTVRNFNIQLSHGSVAVTPGAEPLDSSLQVQILNVKKGTTTSGSAGSQISLGADLGDRIVLLIEKTDVDGATPISIAFNEGLYLGTDLADDKVDDFLHQQLKLEQAPEPSVAGAVPAFTDITRQARFWVDSGNRRVNVDLSSVLQREAIYRLTLKGSLTDAVSDGGDPAPGLKLGQGTIETNGQLAPVGGGVDLPLLFHVRKPAGEIGSFTAATSGIIRGMDLYNNVLFVAALDGGLRAFDVSNPAALQGSAPQLAAIGPPDTIFQTEAVVVDHHGRVYTTADMPIVGVLRSYRVEDFTSGTATAASAKASSIINWKLGYSSMIGLPSNTILSDRPESIPFRLKVIVQDLPEFYEDRQSFVAGTGAQETRDFPLDDMKSYSVTIPFADSQYQRQRITIENATLDMRWSADASQGGGATFPNVLARSTDVLRVIRNLQTYGVVAHLGYGIGVYDLNAMESNRLTTDKAREQLFLGNGKVGRECNLNPPSYAIGENYLNTDIEARGEPNGDLYVYAIHPALGVLDYRIHLPGSQSGVTSTDATCDQRGPTGLLFKTYPDGNEVPRISALRAAISAAGRTPFAHFMNMAQVHWSVTSDENVKGLRGSPANTDAQRDYFLVASLDYGVVVVESKGEPAIGPYFPLDNSHIADVIWIPGGAAGVRVMQESNTAVVTDRNGRVVLVDLSRIDERWDANGKPTTGLFPTAAKAIAGTPTDPNEVGADDPRIIWKSAPGLVSGSLPPVFDSSTGIVYGANMTARVVKAVSAIDPTVKMKVNLGGGLTDVGGIVPLGVAPSDDVQTRISQLPPCTPGTLNCQENASLGAFRLEVGLPGGMVQSLSQSQNELWMAVESERIAGAITEQTPDGFPRSHLRRRRRDGSLETGDRAASNFVFTRVVPTQIANSYKYQRGYNRFISPWIVAIADPRASEKYDWNGASKQQKEEAGCHACERPGFLKGHGESEGIYELFTNGRYLTVRPELAGSNSTVFDGTVYQYLGQKNRMASLFTTIMADTVRPTEVLVAGQNPPVATGMVGSTVFLHSGELHASQSDLAPGGRGGSSVIIERDYRSRTLGGSVFGQGWDSALLRRLRALPNGDVEYRDGSDVWLFHLNPVTNEYEAPKGLFLHLARTGIGWSLVDQQWRVTDFDDLGRITLETDEFYDPSTTGSGNLIRYVYDDTGRLAEIVDPVQRATKFRYWSESEAGASGAFPGLIKQIEDWRQRKLDYEYDASTGTLKKARLADVTNVTGTRPAFAYDYTPAGSSFNDRLEISTDLASLFDPNESGGGTARLRFTYDTSSGTKRDHLIQEGWGTGESASFSYNSPTSVTTTDVLGQRRNYTLSDQPKNPLLDRAHILSMVESGVTVASSAMGELPVSVTPGPPLTTAADRTTTFNYTPEGLAQTVAINGVRTTNFTWTSVEPEAPGSVLTGSSISGPGVSLTQGIAYQSGANSSTFVASVTANGKKVDAPEPSRSHEDLSTNNDQISASEKYDKSGLLTNVAGSGGTDSTSAGASTSISYTSASDAPHRRSVPKQIDDGGLTTKIDYPGPDRSVETDSRGVVTAIDRDAWERPVHMTVTGPQITTDETWEYDATGRTRKHTERQGSTTVTTTYEYDVMGRQTSETVDNVADVGSTTTTMQYNLPSRTIVTNYPGGARTSVTLDSLGRMQHRETTTGASPIVDDYAYDLADNLVYESDGQTATAYAFDARGETIGVLDADGTKTTATLDGFAHPTRIEEHDSAGNLLRSWTFTYTDGGQLTSVTKSAGSQTITMDVAWDGAGRITGVSEGGRATHAQFDTAGRLLSKAKGAGSASSVNTVFDRADATGHDGRYPQTLVKSEKSSSSYNLAMQYNTLGDAVAQSFGNLEWKQQYDQSGNVTSTTAPRRGTHSFEYDSAGSLKSETLPDGAKNSYTHTATGALASFTDPSNEVTNTTNDLIGRPLVRQYKDGTSETIVWEGRRVKSITDRRGRQQTFAYNSKGQISQIVSSTGTPVDAIEYDSAGRIAKWTTPDSVTEYSDFDGDGRPRTTTQSRVRNGSVIDKYTQQHTYDGHGERTSWTMPSYSGFISSNGWTRSVTVDHDAMGNVTQMQRTFFGGTAGNAFLDAGYRNENRPDRRIVTTTSGSQIVRDYGYDASSGLQNRVTVSVGGRVVAGSAVTFDGMLKSRAQLLGISSGSRANDWTYDERGRLTSATLARDGEATPDTNGLTTGDFRTAFTRVPTTPADPPSVTFTEDQNGGHKISVVQRGAVVEQFQFQGGERSEDGQFRYEYDEKGRLSVVTSKSTTAPRRVRYFYDGNDRIVGRRAEYATVIPPTATDWKLEDRPEVLGADALPADSTFVWDPVDDQLVAIFKAGASENPTIDANGGLVRQIIHGGLRFDDPLEVAVADTNSPNGVGRLYPVYDEAGALSLEAVLNEQGRIVSRGVAGGAYGEDEAALNGAAVDKISVAARKDAQGNIVSVDVTLRSTEQIDSSTLAAGVRLAVVDAAGKPVRISSKTPALADSVVSWSLTADEWNALASPNPEVVDGVNLTPAALSIAVTKAARAGAWSGTVPFLSAPAWAVASKPVFTSTDLPVEVRESLANLSQWLASLPSDQQQSRIVYEVPTLYALATPRVFGGSFTADPQTLIVSSSFHAHPFVDPMTGKNYVRARWFDPQTGTWLTPDPRGYVDSSNLYTYAANDPVNHLDCTGEFWSLLIDAGFAAWDTWEVATGRISGKEYALRMALTGVSVLADVATGGMGGGLAVRAAKMAGRTGEVVRGVLRAAVIINRAHMAITAAQAAVSTYDAISHGEYTRAGISGVQVALTLLSLRHSRTVHLDVGASNRGAQRVANRVAHTEEELAELASTPEGRRAAIAAQNAALTDIKDRAEKITDRIIRNGSSKWAQIYNNPSIRGPEFAALFNRNPKFVRSLIRGNIMDDVSKGLAENAKLPFLEITPRGRRGPDFINHFLGVAWDVTTQGSWQKHVDKYGKEFGDLLPLIYR